jgi:hypothetical protein
MNADRMDHMITQYIWTLENDQVFMVKAQAELDRNNFNQFRRLCSSYIAEAREANKELHLNGLSGPEWSFLYLEMWIRMGGFNRLMSNLYHDKDVKFQIDRLKAAGYIITRDGVVAVLINKQTNPETPKEEEMSKLITIENLTLINGVDVTKMSDDQLIDAIKTIEAEISALGSVKTTSKKIQAKKEEALATLAKVVEILDAR